MRLQNYKKYLNYANIWAFFLAYVKKKQYLCTRFMKNVRYIGLIMCLLLALSAKADDVNKPGYQIADNTFFDPSKKEIKTERYQFGMEYRLEIGYAQHWQRAHDISFPDMYLHGARLGATFTFLLPIHFSLQTGVLYSILYGTGEQHWRSLSAQSVQTEYINHRVLAHNITVPLRMFYTIPLWKQLNLFFYTGPQLHIGLAQNDYMQKHLSEEADKWLKTIGVATEPYDRMADELVRANIQWGVGGGLEWDKYRLQSGYDFGLNNLVKHPQVKGQYMSEWGWYVSFCYRF
jgi:hypothetical protein